MPRWMGAHPHLGSTLLAWRNAYRCGRARMLSAAVLAVVGAGVVAILPPTGPVLGWLGRYWAVTFVIATSAFTLSTARRRQSVAIAAATSWLASLPAGSAARMQVVGGTAARLAAVVAFTALAWGAGTIDRSAFSRLAVALSAGAFVGLLAGWRLPQAGVGAPGFHSAAVRRPRARWASAPSLSPLANWPAAQGRVFSRPKRVGPVLILALMAIPMGSPGQVGLAVAGVCIALFALFCLTVAAVRVAFDAARWLSPTTVGKWRFTAALIWRVMLTQVLALAVLLFLTGTIYLHGTVTFGVPLAVLDLGASLAAVLLTALWACHRAGLGAAGRGG